MKRGIVHLVISLVLFACFCVCVLTFTSLAREYLAQFGFIIRFVGVAACLASYMAGGFVLVMYIAGALDTIFNPHKRPKHTR